MMSISILGASNASSNGAKKTQKYMMSVQDMDTFWRGPTI